MKSSIKYINKLMKTIEIYIVKNYNQIWKIKHINPKFKIQKTNLKHQNPYNRITLMISKKNLDLNQIN